MAHRLAVLLAVASILVIVCAAEGPSMEPAATQKYDKKPHVRLQRHQLHYSAAATEQSSLHSCFSPALHAVLRTSAVACLKQVNEAVCLSAQAFS